MVASVIGALRVNLGLDSAQFLNGLKTVQGQLRSVGKSMQSAGRAMSTYVTAPIAGFGGLVVKVAGDFEKSMNQVAAVSGATGDEFIALRDLAKELGAATQFSASQAADAMNFLAMAGMEVNQVLGAMPDTLKLASSAQLDMASAADIVTNILAGYNMGVDELSHATDVLVKAFTSANTDLSQLAEAMKYAGPVASAAGVQFEEAAAAMALMGNAGIQGSMAGTSLRGAMSRMLNPTKGMTTAMHEAGLAFTDAQGRLLPLADIIEQLEPHADNAGLFMELFGQRAGPAMAALVSQGSDAVRELTGELENSAGTADRVSAVQMEGFNGAMRELTSAFEALQLAIADSGLLEFVTDLTKRLTGWVQTLSQTNPEMLKWGTVIAGVTAAIGPLLIGLGLMLTAITAVSAPILAAAAGIIALTAAIVAFWPEIERATAAVVQFGADVVAALASLPGELYQIGVDIMQGLIDGIVSMGSQVIDSMLSPVRDGVNSVKSWLGIQSPSRLLHEIGVNTMQGFAQGMESMSDTIGGIADSIAGMVSGAFMSIIDGSKSVGDAMKDLLKQVVSFMLNNAVKGLMGMLFGGGGGGILGALFGGFRAAGGPVSAGRAYVVGERGPELMVPNSAGRVIPNHELGRGSGGSRDIKVDVGVSVDNDGSLQAYVRSVSEQTTASGLKGYEKGRQKRYQAGSQFG